MRFIAGLILAIAALAASLPAAADQGVYPKTDEERQAAFEALKWQSSAGSYKLPTSHAVIQLPEGQSVLLGADAQRYSWLASGIEFPATEAVLADGTDAGVYYEWRDEGYVSDSDWADVNADDLLEQYRKGAEESNKERVANGREPVEIVGWLEPPHYDAATRTVTYALELKNKNGNWTNAIALRLGRAGYTELTWVGPVDQFKSASGRPALLDHALAEHSFEEGYRYQDFKEGDKVAAYGIAGLVATALGVKFGKGLIAALIAFLIAGKKIAIPAVAVAAVGAWKFVRRLFSRGQPTS